MLTPDDIIYFVVTDRFRDGDLSNNEGVDKSDAWRFHGGDLRGVLEKIPYLQKLGVTSVWISPVYLNIGHFFGTDPYHYYWPLSFEKVDRHLTSAHPTIDRNARGQLRLLSDALAAHQMKLILDMVVNHAGYGADSEFPADWFQSGSGVLEAPLDGLPDFDHDHPDVVDYFVNNILDWIDETGIAAIRMDTAKHVEPRFWNYFKAQVKGRHPMVSLLGEVLVQDSVTEIARFQRDHDFDSLFDFPLRTAIVRSLIWDASMKEIARPRLHPAEPKGVLDLDNPETGGYTNANRLVTLLDNHDLERRIASEARLRHPGDDRTMALRLLRLCLGLLFTTRGIPQIYYGTEIALEGWKRDDGDADLRRDFPWGLFDEASHDVLTTHDAEREQFEFTRKLIELRRRNPALRYGNLITLWVDDLVYAFLRYFRTNVVITVINNGYEDMPFDLEIPIYKLDERKTEQALPDRIIDLITHNDLHDWLEPTEHRRRVGEVFRTRAAGKTCRIYVLNPDA